MANFGFFDSNYQTPAWLREKLSRRRMLKSAAGASALAMMPHYALSESANSKRVSALKKEPWLTLDAVLAHLLPASDKGVSAQQIHATDYLYNLVHQQPTSQGEIDFIYKGVGWLNDYTQSQLKQNFIALNKTQKEQMLRAISASTAGSNWLSMMISNIYEAMLAPPAYGGNPDGIGWKWLEHQAGFPLPKAGQRYYELPKRAVVNSTNSEQSAKASRVIIQKVLKS
ncbi:gluconate 2-dehydrogenase subunit 3 family protein [Thalassotalea ganghwensis]